MASPTQPVTDAAPAAPALPLRVLMADDHDIVHHGLKPLLLDYFGAVKFGEARNADEVLAHYAAADWDVVLLDITMPGRSGLDILEDLKRLRPGVPVLIMSAFPEEEFALRALKSGAAGYLDKRMLASEAVTAIKRVLTGERYVSMALASKLAAQLGGAPRAAHESLSQREFQVLRLIAAGQTIKEIAAELSLSEKTVGTYRTRISEKLGLGTNVELTRYALQHRLVE
jgi:two-component system, NarL family, invasion response regulator UvrY